MPRRRRTSSFGLAANVATCQDKAEPAGFGDTLPTPASTTSSWCQAKGQGFPWEGPQHDVVSPSDPSDMRHESDLLSMSLAEEDEFLLATGLQSPSSLFSPVEADQTTVTSQYPMTGVSWQQEVTRDNQRRPSHFAGLFDGLSARVNLQLPSRSCIVLTGNADNSVP